MSSISNMVFSARPALTNPLFTWSITWPFRKESSSKSLNRSKILYYHLGR